MTHGHSIRTVIFVLMVAASLSGCQQLKLFRHDEAKSLKTATAENPVVEIICLWEAAEGTGLDGLPCRGFAGQLLFFTRKFSEPVKINGDVRIYVFDDLGTPEEQGRPIHQFDFDQAAMQAFLAETNLGAAYQLFIPYTRKGSHRATCSLRVRLTSNESAPVYSRMADVLLPGTSSRKPDEPITPSASRVEQATYEVVAPATKTVPHQTVESVPFPLTTARPQQERTELKRQLEQLVQQVEKNSESQSAHPLDLASPQVSPSPPTTEAPSQHPLLKGED